MSRPSVTLPGNGSKPGRSQLTVMIYLAGDNNLSPSMISQLKAFKDAGFQKDTTVMVRFDPSEPGAPTRIFKVNSVERTESEVKTKIGDGDDPFVRNLRGDEVIMDGPAGRGAMSGNTSESTKAVPALCSFLEICRRQAPANHYMLFVVGHGMVVGNDAFLPDDNPESGISLKELGGILRKFSDDVKLDDGVFDLVAMHSCSMSSIEVAYELRGTARFMMATEGISFVGSWPYRQLLKKIFHSVEKSGGGMDQREMNRLLNRLHFLSLHNSTDFMFAGFSADLALCNLDREVVESFSEPLAALTSALKAALEVSCGAELILLAHWRAQSYWQENYTDLYDFCRCLSALCGDDYQLCRCADQRCDPGGELKKTITAAGRAVMDELDPPRGAGNGNGRPRSAFQNLVAFSSHFGPTYQYSHGLSIYFPWSPPIADGVNDVLAKYSEYEFTKQLAADGPKSTDDSWLSFLRAYFEKTRRASREAEDNGCATTYGRPRPLEAAPAAVTPSGVSVVVSPTGTFFDESLPGGPNGKPSPSLTGKTSPSDSGGVGCGCPSIKNYPTDFPPPPRREEWMDGGGDRQEG